MLFTRQRKEEHQEAEFLVELRDIALKYDINIFYGMFDSKYQDLVDYTDCEDTLKEKEACAYLYESFHTFESKKRFRFEFDHFDPSSLDLGLNEHFKEPTPDQHFFSNDEAPRMVSKSSPLKVLSRNNLGEFLSSGRDILILAFQVCGSNCVEKVKILTEFYN